MDITHRLQLQNSWRVGQMVVVKWTDLIFPDIVSKTVIIEKVNFSGKQNNSRSIFSMYSNSHFTTARIM